MEAQEANDRSADKELLLDVVAKNSASSPHEILQEINRAVSKADGGKLDAKVLTGGLNNLSYKIFVDKQPDLAVYAKLCFEHLVVNPDLEADLGRVDNEYEMLEIVSRHSPGSVVAPLACWDLERDGRRMKALVTEWSEGDEQLANQFIDGAVDPRIAPRLAETLLALHAIEGFDPEFNAGASEAEFYEVLGPLLREMCGKKVPDDRTEAHCASEGEDAVVRPFEAMLGGFLERECLIHNDLHVFNVLVEPKPSIEQLENFGPRGAVTVIDWELGMAGQPGKDVGMALFYPIGCMLAHALNGHPEAKESIASFVNSLLDAYASGMAEAGKADGEVAGLLRSALAWCGFHQYSLCYFGREFYKDSHASFPVETEDQRLYVCDAVGLIGFKLARFCDREYLAADTGSKEMRERFDSIVEEEVARASGAFASGRRRGRQRKSSMLRAADRRISDAGLLARSLRSLSVANADDE